MKKIVFLTIILSLAVSCKKHNIISNTISKKKFIEVLTDLHHADGILFATKLSERMEKEKISMYNYVFKKNDVSREEFYNTLSYYTIHSDKFLKVYEEVIKNLNEKYQVSNKIKEVKKRKYDPNNLWQKDYEYNLPEEGKKNPIAFKIYTEAQGSYNLRADIMVHKDDKSVDLRMTIIATYSDKSTDLNTIGIPIKDDKFHKYETYIITDKNKKLKEISGWILDHSEGTIIKHIKVKNIKLSVINDFSPDSLKLK